ncbi:efflux transporter outer membrane subunit [Rhodanobacter lindaniclasticus]
MNPTDSGPCRRVFLLGALLCMLAGCAEPLPKLAPPQSAQWRHAAASTPAAPVDLDGWWHAFHDPALDALVERALADNLDVAQAVERLRAARILHRHAGDRYLPSLAARTGDAIDPDASAAFFVAGFDASWELGLFGRAEGNRRVAQGELDASVADLRAARVSLVAEVVREWIGLRTAQRQEQLLQQVSAERHHAWQLLQTRQRLQLAAPVEVDQAEAASAQAEAALAAPRQAIDASAQRLAVLLGREQPDPAWLQPGPPPELGAWRLGVTPADLLRTRPEIARAEADVLRAAGELALAHADMFPSIGIGGSLQWATDINNNHRFSTTPNAIASLGPVINLPLFDWGMRVAAHHAQGHQLKASVLAYRQAVLQGVAEVETALGSLHQQRQREQHDQAAWQALQRADQALGQRVALHLDSPLEQTDGRIAATQAALELDEARAAHGLAYVALFKALGGAPRPPLLEPSPAAASSAGAPR